MSHPQNPDYKPRLPAKTGYGIGIVGCGGIVNYAHLVAYKNNGLNVVACYDVNAEAARKTAETHRIPKVHDTLDALLADAAVEIVDIAVQPWHQRAIAEQALAAGKHVLCQKPLADTIENAQAIVDAGKRAGRKVAVNQQMRWSAGIAAARDLIAKGFIGQPTDAQIQVTTNTPWHMWPWLAHVASAGDSVPQHPLPRFDARVVWRSGLGDQPSRQISKAGRDKPRPRRLLCWTTHTACRC